MLSLREFEFVVAEAEHLVNKRPIGLRSMLPPNKASDLPFSITPEILIKGYTIPSLNILPSATSEQLDDPDWSPAKCSALFDSFRHLNSVRNNIASLYDDLFILDLKKKATDSPDRFKRRNQFHLKVDDVVSIRSSMIKPFHYPVGTVTSIERNSLDEINAVLVRKPNGEVVRRHPQDIKPLLSVSDDQSENSTVVESVDRVPDDLIRKNPIRKAKTDCMKNTRHLADSHLV